MSMGHDFIDIFYGENDATNFTAQLFRLIAKADYPNQHRLRGAFPKEVELYEWWMRRPMRPAPSQVMEKAEKLESAREASK